MAFVLLTFCLVLGIIFGGYFLFVLRPETREETALRKRLRGSIAPEQARVGTLERPAERLSRRAGAERPAVADDRSFRAPGAHDHPVRPEGHGRHASARISTARMRDLPGGEVAHVFHLPWARGGAVRGHGAVHRRSCGENEAAATLRGAVPGGHRAARAGAAGRARVSDRSDHGRRRDPGASRQ